MQATARFLIVAACLSIGGVGRLQADILPPGGEDVIPARGFTYRGTATDGRVEFPPPNVPAQPIRFATLRATEYPWDLAIQSRCDRAIEKNDVLLFTARVRAIQTVSETGDARVEIVFEQTAYPHDKSLIARTGVRPEDGWKTVFFPFRSQHRYEAGTGQVSLRPGFGPQVMEFAEIRVVNYRGSLPIEKLPRTQATYAGREADAAWRGEAERRIEQLRKGDLTIRVVDAQGKAVPNAQVRVRMNRHAYAFGSAVNASGILQPGPEGDRYREHIVKLFNRVVLASDLKWPNWLKDRQPADEALRWLNERKMPVRGHCIVWPSWQYTPGFLKAQANDPAFLRAAIANRVREITAATRGKVVEWDVVNEPYSQRDLLDLLGDEVMVEWFQWARQTDPNARLYINDFPSLAGGKHLEHYLRTIAMLRAKGAPLDGIGLQCHYGADLVPPVQIWKSLDRFAEFGLPIQATELDIENNDERLQADYLRDHMIAFFSHPATTGVVMWGFWEGRHWKPTAALYRKDWSIKPNGQAWHDLVFKQWWTDTEAATDATGSCRVRGFLGEYDVAARLGDREATLRTALPREGAALTLKLP